MTELPTEHGFADDANRCDVYDPAMKMIERYEARVYLHRIALLCAESNGCTYERGLDIAKSNVGYWAGYHDRETRTRVERLFDCVHPMLGPVAETPIDPEEIFRMGGEYAKGNLKEHVQRPGLPMRNIIDPDALDDLGAEETD